MLHELYAFLKLIDIKQTLIELKNKTVSDHTENNRKVT